MSQPIHTVGMETRILLLRGQKVLLDVDLAELYGVSTKRLNEQVKRNPDRFPPDFMFQLNSREKAEVVANCDHLKNLRFSATLSTVFAYLTPRSLSKRVGEGSYTDLMPTHAKVVLSRALRQRSTFSEKIAWNMLRDRRLLGFKFQRQHVVRGFVLDFYCFELRLAIEIDGDIHVHQKEYDAMRQGIIEREGLSFVRISADDLVESPERLLIKIRDFIAMKI